jgi:hypothetical protein
MVSPCRLLVVLFPLLAVGSAGCAPAEEGADSATGDDDLVSDVDFTRSTCGDSLLSGDVLLRVLGAKERRTFGGLTVRHRTRVCTTTGDPNVATCSAWSPTVKIANSALTVSVQAGTRLYGFPEYREVSMREGSSGLSPSPTNDVADFYLSYPDRELRVNGRVENRDLIGLTNWQRNANVISSFAQSRGSDRCLWVKGQLRAHNGVRTPDHRWGFTEQEILYTASNYQTNEL